MTVLGKPVEISLDTILFATDFSKSAETAKLYVKALAERYQSAVRLMHVVNLSPAYKAPDAGISIEAFRKLGQDSLDRVYSEFASEKIRVERILGEGIEPTEEILQAAHDPSVDLLVIGTRAHKGLARLVLGSTAASLIHRARCPILTVGPAVRPPQKPLTLDKVVYATDFSPEAAKAAVFALSFAQDFGAHLYMCHVLPGPDTKSQLDGQELNDRFMKELEGLVPEIAREWCEPECILEHGYAADGILLLARRLEADLIVLGTRYTSHWHENLKTGVAFQVIASSDCPVLTIRG